MRAFVAFLLALSGVLAGCLSPEAETPGAVLDDAPAALAPTGGVLHGFDAAPLDVGMLPALGAQFHTGASAAEPTVAVTSDGVVFLTGMTAPGATGRRAPTVYRSLDAGQTWEDVGPKLPTGDGMPPVTNDPYVYADPATDRVFQLDLVGTACSVLSWTDDRGDSWTTNPLACGTPGGNDHQTMVAAAPRLAPTVLYPSILYYCVNRVADTSCATSLDGGLAWTPLKSVSLGVDPAFEFPLCGGTSGHLKAAPDGTVYLPKSACSVQSSPPVVWVTEDDGLTWSVRVIDTEHLVDGHEVAVAIDEEGNVYATWQSGGLHYFAASTDKGASWSPARLVTPPGVTATEFNAIAAGKRGHVAFAYIGTTIEGGYEGKPLGNAGLAGDILGQPRPPEWENATWNAYMGIMTDALAEEPVIQTVTLNDPADPLARGLCGRTRCHGMADFIDMVIDTQGRPWAAFVDVCLAECIEDPAVQFDGNSGFAGTLLEGPALRGAEVLLAPLR